MPDPYSPAVKLLGQQYGVRQDIRSLWKKDAGDLISAHEIALSSVASLVNRFSGRRFEKATKSIEGRMSLTAQFIQGVDICETSISEGLYSQAAALLKQQMETVAAIDEFKNERRKDGKTPNIGNGILRSLGPIYGDLNDIAHVSREGFARQLVVLEKGDICAPSLVPKYNKELASFLYGYHVYFIVEIGKQIADIFEEVFQESLSEKEQEWMTVTLLMLLNMKVIDLPEEAKNEHPVLAKLIKNGF